MNTETEFLIPNSIRIAELVKDLVKQFSLKTETAKTITRTYFDSFDCRLYNKKLLLLSETDFEGRKMTLRPLDASNLQRTLPVEKYPVFASDFESFVFRKKLTPILGIRALIPQFTVQYRCNPLRFVDKDEKTRLRILLENPKLVLPEGRYRMLGKRIKLIPVNGHTKPLKKISHYLQNSYSLRITDKDIFQLSLELLNKQPGDYSSKLKLNLNLNMSASAALKTILLTLFHTIELNEEGVIKDIDTEFLHDFRVAVRRSRSAMSQIKHTLYQDELEIYRHEFGWLSTITGPTRDSHVYLLKFGSYQQALPKKIRPHLAPLRNYIKGKNQKEHKQLVKNLESSRYKKLKREWQKFLESPLEVTVAETNAEKPIKQVADARIWKMYRRVIKEGKNIRADSSDAELHKLRISCKKLRYLLEFFENLYPGTKMKHLINSLKHLQDVLGDFNDYRVQIESLNDIEDRMAREVGLPEETKQAIDMLVKILNSKQQELRAVFSDSFKRFHQKKYQSMFDSLFKPVN